MAKEFPLETFEVESIETKHRKVSGLIPNQETIDKIKKLRTFEARSMRGQPPVVWDRAEGFYVFDGYGNKWLDFSSGVLIANAGHGRKEIVDAVINQVSKPLLTTYCFPNWLSYSCESMCNRFDPLAVNLGTFLMIYRSVIVSSMTNNSL